MAKKKTKSKVAKAIVKPEVAITNCLECDGTGYTDCPQCGNPETEECRSCGGSGEVEED